MKQDAVRLTHEITANPNLAQVVAGILQVDMRDVASLSAGQTTISAASWRLLWAALEPHGVIVEDPLPRQLSRHQHTPMRITFSHPEAR